MTMLHSQRPQAAPRAARLAVACLLLALLAALFAPATTGAFATGLRGSPDHATAANADTISAIHAADAVGDLDTHPDGLEPVGSRHLLHGFMPFWTYPPCQWGCKVSWCIWGWWFGHCRSGPFLYTCYWPKWWPYWPYWPFLTAFSDVTLSGAAEDSEVAFGAVRAPESARAAPPAPGTRSSFQQDLTASAPYVACSGSSDCTQLSASAFGPVDGAEPAVIAGRLVSFCKRPDVAGDSSGVFSDFPGVCMCVYVSPQAPPETVEAVADTVLPPGGPGGGPGPFLPPPGSGGPSGPLLPPFPGSRFVTTDFCVQSSGAGESRTPQDHPVHPFFVPGQPPITIPGAATAAPDGRGPTQADIVPSGSVVKDSIVGQAFVDGLP